MPTWGKKHAYKHYFPLVLFSDEARRFATVACLVNKHNMSLTESILPTISLHSPIAS